MCPAHPLHPRTPLQFAFQGGRSVVLKNKILIQEHLGAIILEAMPKKARRDLLLKFVREDPVLKQQIVKDIKDSEKLEVKADFSEDDGFGSERAESSEEKLVVSDLSCGGEQHVDKEVANMAAVTTESDDNFDETKEQRLDEQTGVSNVDLTSRCPDPDRSGIKMMDPKPKEDYCARKEEIEGSCCSSDKKEEPAASDTDVFEDDEDEEEEEEWEYEWEEGEDNEYEFMEQSEDEDDYTVESFAGSFSVSISK